MTIDEQIAILEAYKAGKRINIEAAHGIKGFAQIERDGEKYEFNFGYYHYSIAPSFILVNGVKVPAPVRVMPERGTVYYYPYLADDTGTDWQRCGSGDDDAYALRNGVMHLTEAAAREHYEALILPSKQK